MQGRKDCAVRKRKFPFPEGVDGYIIAQEGTQTIEVACFMGRGNPLSVAVSVRNFGNEVRGSFPVCVPWCRRNEGDKSGHRCNCNQEECEGFHKGSSIRPAFYSNPIGLAGLTGPGIDS
jgi:hypothetical protein